MHVVIAHVLPSDQLAKIGRLTGDMEASYVGELLATEYHLLRDRPQDTEAELAGIKGLIDDAFASAEVVFVPATSFANLISRLAEAASPRLRWLQITAAGVDQLRSSGVIERPVLITTGRGLYSQSMAEYCIWAIMTLNRHMLRRFRDQSQRIWNRRSPPSRTIKGQTLGIVGLGSIGSKTALLAKGLGMRTIATRRSATRREANVEGVDEVFPREEIFELLNQSDFVLLSLPYTPETLGIIGERELKAMKPSAHLINISRGEVVDQDALIRALKEGWIRGAALDVFTPEPLPLESALWDLPNVIITPHISANAGDTTDAAVELFCQNLQRYLADEPLINEYDRGKGY